MTYCTDRDQEQRLESYAAIEEIYLSGITDGVNGVLPAMPELTYLQGYAEGMRQLRAIVRLSPLPEPTEVKEYPLLCHQCHYLNNGLCGIKGITRNGNQYACDRISVDCPF